MDGTNSLPWVPPPFPKVFSSTTHIFVLRSAHPPAWGTQTHSAAAAVVAAHRGRGSAEVDLLLGGGSRRRTYMMMRHDQGSKYTRCRESKERARRVALGREGARPTLLVLDLLGHEQEGLLDVCGVLG